MPDGNKKGTVLLECCQEIPCNPCATVCKTGAITKETLNSGPVFHPEKCVGCKLCVAACPGQAIFFLEPEDENGMVGVTFPYEYLPLPEVGQEVTAVDRMGQPVCPAKVRSVERRKASNRTVLVTLAVPAEHAGEVRFMKRLGREVE